MGCFSEIIYDVYIKIPNQGSMLKAGGFDLALSSPSPQRLKPLAAQLLEAMISGPTQLPISLIKRYIGGTSCYSYIRNKVP